MNNPVRLTCPGCEILGLSIPPFQVGEGELLRLIFPPQSDVVKLFETPDLLTRHIDARKNGQDPRPPAFLPIIYPHAEWRSFFRTQTAIQWLVENCDLPSSMARRQLQYVGICPDDRLDMLAGNPRALLGMLYLLHSDTNAIVFHTMAISTATKRMMLKIALDHLNTKAGVYCQTYYSTGGRTVLDEFDLPFSRTIHLTNASHSPPNRLAS